MLLRNLVYIFLSLLFLIIAIGCRSKSKESVIQGTDIIEDSISEDTVTGALITDRIKEWHAGTFITLQEVENIGLDSCFTIKEIDDKTFQRINGISYSEEGVVKIEELRWLKVIHFDGKGNIKLGELICNEKIADQLIEIFKVLYEAKYPIESIRLIDEFDGDDIASMRANNTSCFNNRKTSGGSKISRHAYGMALDLNPLYNPYVNKTTGKFLPPEAQVYTDRLSDFAFKIDTEDLSYKEFTKRGFKWGGNWRNIKDYQHFQK